MDDTNYLSGISIRGSRIQISEGVVEIIGVSQKVILTNSNEKFMSIRGVLLKDQLLLDVYTVIKVF